MPEEIDVGEDILGFVYLANGTRIMKDGNSIQYYSGSFIHAGDGSVEQIYTGAGRVTHTATGYEYEYFLTDHIGNVRVSFADMDRL